MPIYDSSKLKSKARATELIEFTWTRQKAATNKIANFDIFSNSANLINDLNERRFQTEMNCERATGNWKKSFTIFVMMMNSNQRLERVHFIWP